MKTSSYLSHNVENSQVDAPPTTNAVRSSITEWAVDKVGSNRPPTLYLMDHGVVSGLYLDKPEDQNLTPGQLNS